MNKKDRWKVELRISAPAVKEGCEVDMLIVESLN